MGVEQLRNIDVEWCKHGIPADVCSACHPELDPDYEPPVRKIVYRFVEKPEDKDQRQQVKDLYLWGISERPRVQAEDVKALHVSIPPTKKLLRQILADFPNLRVVQMSQGRYRQYIEGRKVAELLKEKGIEVRVKTWREKRKSHLYWVKDGDYYKRRQFFLSLNSEQRQKLERAAELGFVDERMMIERYFCLGDPEPPRISFVDLGSQCGMDWKLVRKRVIGLLGFLDYPHLPEDQPAQDAVKSFSKRFEKAVKAEKEAAIRAQYEQYRPLPPDLRPAHWKNFLELTRIQQESPELLKTSFFSDDRIPTILVDYYGLKDERHNFEEIGGSFEPPISGERTRLLRNKGLIELDI